MAKTMTLNKILTCTMILQIVVLATLVAAPAQTRTQPARAAQPATFDHSSCQYPDRWSNPVEGCDNSDPAVPECIKEFSTKAGEEACIAAFVAQQGQPAPKPSKPQPPKVSECGDK